MRPLKCTVAPLTLRNQRFSQDLGSEKICDSLDASPRSYRLILDNNCNFKTLSLNPDVLSISPYAFTTKTKSTCTTFTCDGVREDGYIGKVSLHSNSDVPLLGPDLSSKLYSRMRQIRTSLPSASLVPEPILQAFLPQQTTLKHPTPDLQTLQGAYVRTVEHLEKTAELLSMTSHIEDAIKNLHDEQKRSESRHSSASQVSTGNFQIDSNNFSNNEAQGDIYPGSQYLTETPISPLNLPKTNLDGVQNDNSSLNTSSPRLISNGKFGHQDSFPTESTSSSSSTQDRKNSSEIHRDSFQPFDNEEIETQNSKNSEVKDYRDDSKAITSQKGLSPAEVMEKMFADFDGSYLDQNFQDDYRSSLTDNSLPIAATKDVLRLTTEDPLSRSLAGCQKSNDGLEIDNQMVYYPAPVPTMLNLPQRLSKRPLPTPHNFRKSYAMTSQNIPQNLTVLTSDTIKGNVAAGGQTQEYLSPQPIVSTARQRPSRDLANLPPQLRASTFFEKKSENSEVVELKDQSAVTTLESILDASALAPVCAFTDHTFAGALGPEVYGKKKEVRNRSSPMQNTEPKKRTSTFSFFGKRDNKNKEGIDAAQDQGKTRIRSTKVSIESESEAFDKDVISILEPVMEEDSSVKFPSDNLDDRPGDESSDEGQLEDEIYEGPPTTLLAELQLRKQRQKQRTQPLTKTFPNGIHSTLLELDTAIQTEQKTRRKGRTILAWEDPTALEAQAAMQNDDDIPLAMLYSNQPADNHPLSLLEQRELEENESLSQRRNRLQGRAVPVHRPTTINNNSNFMLAGEVEEETLRDRAKRLKATNIPPTRPVSEDFGSQVLDHFDINPSDSKFKQNLEENSHTKMPEEEETLGQRRKRLQAGREVSVNSQLQQQFSPPDLKSRKSMADILPTYPSGDVQTHLRHENPSSSLLALHEKHAALRSASMLNLNKIPRTSKAGLQNENQAVTIPSKSAQYISSQTNIQTSPQQSLGHLNVGRNLGNNTGPPVGIRTGIENTNSNLSTQMQGYMKNANMPMASMSMASAQPIEQGQMDMIERWRQSVMPLSKPATLPLKNA